MISNIKLTFATLMANTLYMLFFIIYLNGFKSGCCQLVSEKKNP